MAKGESRLSPPTVLRLSEYLLILEQFIKENKEIISSRELATAYGNNANQVRQDIFHLENSGRLGQGYSTWELAEEIRRTLGLSDIKKVCIVGIGNLGKALATHVPFSNYGMKLHQAFDTDKTIIGTKINDISVQHGAGVGRQGRPGQQHHVLVQCGSRHHQPDQTQHRAALLLQVPPHRRLPRLLQPRQVRQEVLCQASRQAEEDIVQHQGQGETQLSAHRSQAFSLGETLGNILQHCRGAGDRSIKLIKRM